jgi:tripartite-type tricarboxylate transporter receptor subunit TctC
MKKAVMILPALGLAIFAGLPASPAAADPVADFYKGKQIKMIIRTAAGGGYDLDARLLMRHMTRHIPGKPTAININMPGGGGLKAANYVAKVAPRDGTVLTIVGGTIPMYQGLQLGGKLEADMKAFNWIGVISTSNRVLAVWHTSPARTVADMKKRTINIGATGAGSPSVILPAVLNNVVGTKLKIISGYKGGTEIDAAMEKGELEGRGSNPWSSWVSSAPRLVNEKLVRPMVQVGFKPDPQLPGVVPLLKDLGETPEQTEILVYATKAFMTGFPFATAQAVPADRVKALRAAFDATMKDPVFLAEAKKRGLNVDPMTGDAVEKLIVRFHSYPERIVDRARKSLEIGKVARVKLRLADGTIAKVSKKHMTLKDGAGQMIAVKIHAKRSKVTVTGKKARTSALKTGMACRCSTSAPATWRPRSTASSKS